MPIPLNQDLVRELIDQRFGSVDDLVVEWEARVASRIQRVGRPRDRSTIYRWIEKGLPTRRNDIFGFAGVLDVDPVAMLDIDIAYIERVFPRERRLFQLGYANQSPLSPFWPIFVPGPAWPDEEIAQNYYGRSWCTKEFVHDLSQTTDDYAAVYLQTMVETDLGEPRTYHFAYRRHGARDKMWRPYGTVVGYRNKVRLVSESGDFQEVSDDRSSTLVVAETHFGKGPAEFRIASLHEFELRFEVPSRETNCVQFLA